MRGVYEKICLKSKYALNHHKLLRAFKGIELVMVLEGSPYVIMYSLLLKKKIS